MSAMGRSRAAWQQFARGERHGRGVEDAAGEPNEGNDEDEFEGIDDVVAEL